MLGAGELPPSAQPPRRGPVPSSPGPLVEGLADDRGDVRLAFDRKTGETLTVVIDVTLRDVGHTGRESFGEADSGLGVGVHGPLRGQTSLAQTRWAMARLWVCISTSRVVKYRMMSPTRFPFVSKTIHY